MSACGGRDAGARSLVGRRRAARRAARVRAAAGRRAGASGCRRRRSTRRRRAGTASTSTALHPAATTPTPALQLPIDLPTMLRDLENAYINAALTHTGSNKKEAAKLLGMGRTTLVEKFAAAIPTRHAPDRPRATRLTPRESAGSGPRRVRPRGGSCAGSVRRSLSTARHDAAMRHGGGAFPPRWFYTRSTWLLAPRRRVEDKASRRRATSRPRPRASGSRCPLRGPIAAWSPIRYGGRIELRAQKPQPALAAQRVAATPGRSARR